MAPFSIDMSIYWTIYDRHNFIRYRIWEDLSIWSYGLRFEDRWNHDTRGTLEILGFSVLSFQIEDDMLRLAFPRRSYLIHRLKRAVCHNASRPLYT